MMLVFDVMLCLLVLATALFIVGVEEKRTAIAGIIALGFLLSLAWLRLESVDVALTEAAIGGGATGILLLRANARMDRAGMDEEGLLPFGAGAVVTAFGAGLLGLAIIAAAAALPVPAPSLAGPVMARLHDFGIANPVTGVLLGYRALDTLLEKIVLLVGLLGIWSLAPDKYWAGYPARLHTGAPGGPLVLTARILPPFGVLVGIYLVWTGADEPGGTFQGGAILAAMWMLPMMAGLVAPPRLDARWLRLVLFAGPALFIAVGLAGFGIAEGFLSYPPQFAKPILVGVEVALTAAIAAVAMLMIIGPATRDAP
jgi:multisubunit Na+/H+ antiporter MnhB subunit